MPPSPHPDPEVLQDRADRPVLRVGDRVRHPAQAWSGSVQALLAHLRAVGFTEAPRPYGLTADGDEVEFIPGVGGDDACLLVDSDTAVAAVGELLRRYHDAVAGWRTQQQLRWFDDSLGTGDGERLVCHGDVGPWNLIWREGKIVGLIDWEHAHVGTRTSDIAYALHYLAPIRDRSYWQGVLGLDRRPRRRHRMRIFAEAYGIGLDDDLVEQVMASQEAGVDLMRSLAERGDPRRRQLVADGELDREVRAVAWTRARRAKFLPRPR
ncbi:MAG: aminoglycoside phosphotransferase family protein [Propionibacteriaceae bacterium]